MRSASRRWRAPARISALARSRRSGLDVVHAHDWQAALAAGLSATTPSGRAREPSITIHNIAFQGHFPGSIFGRARACRRTRSTIDGVEYYGGVGYLKAGLQLADRITTVSPTYAREIMTPEFGMGLDGLLRIARRRSCRASSTASTTPSGIPATDAALPQTYSALRIDMRAAQQDRAADPDRA